MSDKITDFRKYISEYVDFPKSGILFRDISPLLASPVGMEAAVERFRLKRADVLVASDRKTSSSPRAQSQVVPAGTSHPRFSWHANMQLPRERD